MLHKLHSKDPSDLEKILGYTTTGMTAFVQRTNRVMYNEVWPFIFTKDSSYRRLLLALVRELPKVAPIERNEAGELINWGISSDWSEFHTVMPVLPNPAGTPPWDSSSYARDALKDAGVDDLATKEMKQQRIAYIDSYTLPPSVETLMSKFMKVFLGRVILTSFPVKRTSSMGLPHMTSDVIPKAAVIRQWLDGKQLAASMRSFDVRTLADQGLVFAYFNGYRAQLEGAVHEGGKIRTKKVRQVFDWKGKWSVMDRTLPKEEGSDGAELASQLLCARSRTISASPFAATLPFRLMARAIEKGIGDAFPYTFKHRDQASIEAKLQSKRRLKMTDVKSHDQMMPPFAVTAFCEALRTHFGDTLADWTALMFRAPMLVKNDYRDERGAVLRGNPLDLKTFTANYVNPSGIPVTSGLAKAVGAFYIYLACVNKGVVGDTENDMLDFLQGRSRVQLLNLGDNNCLMTDVPELFDFVDNPGAYLPFALLDESDTFAGYTIVREERGGLILRRNITTYIKNLVAPDRTMSHPMKGNWAVSLPIKRMLYGTHPAYGVINDVLERLVAEHLHTTLDALAAATPQNEAAIRGMNLIDADFMNNPESLEYKYDVTDITPALLEQYYITGSANDAERILGYFK